MATITNQVSGSPLIGSPIVYEVVAASLGTTVFHRVKLQVVAGLQGGDYVTIEMSSMAENGEHLKFDVSSALMAVADAYIYTPTPPEYYPYLQYYLVAWDEYMQDGVNHQTEKNYFPANYAQNKLRALMGAYSDMDRLLAGETKTTHKFSRKPATMPEIVTVGDTFIRPADMDVHSATIEHGQQSVVYNVNQPGLLNLGGSTVYAVPRDGHDYYQMRFVNGLGCLESVTVRAFRKVTTKITTEQFTRAVQETFGTFSRGIAVKKNNFETWKLTSGPVDEAWQSWFVHEFLMARWAWINVRQTGNPVWVACHILPDEEVNGINRVDSGMLEVPFSVQLDITGSALYQLAI